MQIIIDEPSAPRPAAKISGGGTARTAFLALLALCTVAGLLMYSRGIFVGEMPSRHVDAALLQPRPRPLPPLPVPSPSTLGARPAAPAEPRSPRSGDEATAATAAPPFAPPLVAAQPKVHVNVARAAVEARESQSGCKQSLLSLGNFDQLAAGLRNVCPSTPAGVSMQCSHRNMRDVHENVCRLQGAVLDMHGVADYVLAAGHARPHKPQVPELTEPPNGLVLLPCHGAVNTDVFSRHNVGHGGQEWLQRALVVREPDASTPLCEAWLDTTLYVMADTYDPINVWHAFEDVTHVFEAYGGLGIDDRHARVVIADLPFTPATNAKQDLATYFPVWQAAFSGGNPPVSLARMVLDATVLQPLLEPASISPALKKALQANSLADFWRAPSPTGQHRGLCLRDAVFSVHGGVSVMTRDESHCPRSSFMRGLIDHITDRLPPSAHSRPRNDRILRLTYARRDVGAFGSRNVGEGRGFPSEGPIIEALKALADVDVVAVDPGTLSLEQQYALFRSTDLLVGLHGAALAWGLFLADHGGLVEVQVGGFRCHCFSHISAWRELSYQLVQTSAQQDVQSVVQPVLAAVHAVMAEIRGKR